MSKILEILDRLVAKRANCRGTMVWDSNKELTQAEHDIREAIVEKLPKEQKPLCNYSHPPGQTMCPECYSNFEEGYNECLSDCQKAVRGEG
jgi:hypothetical protein